MDDILNFFGKTVLGIIGTVAPTLATALGGPLAGAAVSAIAGALGMSPDSAPQEVAAAIKKANPETLAALQSAEKQFVLDMERIGIEREKLVYTDRENARQREIQMKDWMPRVLTLALVGMLIALVTMILKGYMPADETSKTIIVKVMGLLENGFFIVLGYYFSSVPPSAFNNLLGGKK